MRYCLLTFVLAFFAAAIGCQAPLHQSQSPCDTGACPPGMGGPAMGHGMPMPGIPVPGCIGICGKAPCGGRLCAALQMREPVGPGAVPGYFNDMNGAGSMYGAIGTNRTSQVQFIGPEGMIINYDVSQPGMFDSEPLSCPCIHNFGQEAIYRLKLSNIPNMMGRDLYPTVEIAPAFARTEAFLSHSMVPIEFTDNDFDQVAAGNFIVKVIYLPYPEFQGLATAGVGTLVNTQLEPGVDPIVEAENRGSILAVVRIGNKDMSQASNPANSNGNVIYEQSSDPGTEQYGSLDTYGATRLPQPVPMQGSQR